VPFVDRGAKEQTLTGCIRCKRGYPPSEMFWGADGPLCPECQGKEADDAD
jgi:hypothetical protein